MRHHILGVGSVGTLIAHHLRLSSPTSRISLIVPTGRNIPSIARPDIAGSAPETYLTVTRDGYRSVSHGFDIERYRRSADTSTAGVGYDDVHLPNARIDSLIICLKTVTTVPAMRSIAPRLGPSSVVTLLQNGMGTYDELCAHVFPDPRARPFFVLGTTTHGVGGAGVVGEIAHNSPPGQGNVQYGVVPDPRNETDLERWLFSYAASNEPILSPPPSPALPLPSPPPDTPTPLDNLHGALTALLSMSELAPALLPMPHLHHQLLLKLALNAAINPLTAILGLGALPNGALLSSTTGYSLVKRLMFETSAVLTAYLCSIHAPAPPPEDILRLFSHESLIRRAHALIRQTGSNTSSMAADVMRAQQTEIGAINGYIAQLGTRLDVPTPVHRMVTDMVKYISAVSGLDKAVPSHYRLPLRRAKADLGVAAAMSMEERKLELQARRLEIDERVLRAKEEEVQLKLVEQRARRRRHKARERNSATDWYENMVSRKQARGETEDERVGIILKQAEMREREWQEREREREQRREIMARRYLVREGSDQASGGLRMGTDTGPADALGEQDPIQRGREHDGEMSAPESESESESENEPRRAVGDRTM